MNKTITAESRAILTRRAFVGASLGAAAQFGCGPSKHDALRAYAFVANSEGATVAVADLATFAVARQIRMDGQPSQVTAPAGRPSVYVLMPASGSVHEIAVQQLKVQRKLRLGQSAVSMRMSPDGSSLYVLLAQPKKLVRIGLDRFETDWELPLPMNAVDFDVDTDTSAKAPRQVGAISYGTAGSFAFFDPADRKLFPAIELGGEVGKVRFQYGRELIVASLTNRALSVYDSQLQRRMVELPLKNRPDQLCFNADSGQLFVTGEGSDAVSVVYPYRTPEVAETVLAGRQPGAMAVSEDPSYLFIANPSSGDVTILNSDHKVMAIVSVGAEPCCIATTPNSEFALVLNRKSGDMAVLRIGTINRNRILKSASLFTMIPVGSAPVSVAVRMI